MAEIFNKLLNAFGLDTDTEPFVDENEVSRLYRDMPEQEYDRSFTSKKRHRVVQTAEGDLSMMLVKPKTHEDAQIIIDNLLQRKPVIVNMEDNDFAVSQRLIDFVSGAVYALDGEVKSISSRIIAFLPKNIELSTGE
ncbi:MAG: cell division protein SepF [Eubacteriales bacterium]